MEPDLCLSLQTTEGSFKIILSVLLLLNADCLPLLCLVKEFLCFNSVILGRKIICTYWLGGRAKGHGVRTDLAQSIGILSYDHRAFPFLFLFFWVIKLFRFAPRTEPYAILAGPGGFSGPARAIAYGHHTGIFSIFLQYKCAGPHGSYDNWSYVILALHLCLSVTVHWPCSWNYCVGLWQSGLQWIYWWGRDTV